MAPRMVPDRQKENGGQNVGKNKNMTPRRRKEIDSQKEWVQETTESGKRHKKGTGRNAPKIQESEKVQWTTDSQGIKSGSFGGARPTTRFKTRGSNPTP